MDLKTDCKEFRIWFGADVSKNTFDASVCIPEKELTEVFSMPKKNFQMTEEGVVEFKNWAIKELTKYDFESDTRFGLVMESTGSYSKRLVTLVSASFPQCIPSIADPKSIKNYGKSLRIRNKTDQLDAAIIAKYGAERNPQPYVPQAVMYSYIKELVRQRRSIVNMLTSAKLQAQETSQVKAIIVSRNEIVKRLKQNILKLDLAIEKHINEFKELKEQVEILKSIPGTARTTAAIIIGELGDVRRFSSSKKIAAFAGVSPKRYESGTSIKCKTRMCKEGQGRIRQALFLASLSATRGNNGFARFYKMLVLNGKSKMAALGAVMRKMICVMRRLLIDKTPFNDMVLTPVILAKKC